ncbi:tetratricopeptide repeat protein [Maricaulis parjimensis]|uniref:tetratricopeptide repeat protein n=1 Tax=Maricaulis parjimensis TaxID=144023 RepID=UPI001939FE87|nr:tetratricopeptide repeat protein [Maricaulis parjimensis]
MIRDGFYAGVLLLCAIAGPATAQGTDIAVAPNASESAFDGLFDRFLALAETEPRDPDAEQALRADVQAQAEQGLGNAMNLLGVITDTDFGGPANPEAAYAIFQDAAALGDAGGNINVAIRDLLSWDEDRQVSAVTRLRRLLERDDLQDGLPDLIIGYLGVAAFFEVDGTTDDLAEALELVSAGLQADPRNSLFNRTAGQLLESGEAGPRNPAAALSHYQAAGLAGDGFSAWKAGMMLINGDGVSANEEEAFLWVQRSAETGYDDGLISLAVMHAVGQGTPVNAPEARTLYRNAASRGNLHAMRGLGSMLVFGEGGPDEPRMGVALLQMAAQRGDLYAIDIMQRLQPHLPADPAWQQGVDDAGRAFLDNYGLTPDSLYGQQATPPIAPTVIPARSDDPQ